MHWAVPDDVSSTSISGRRAAGATEEWCRCDDRRHVRQDPTTQTRAQDGQPSPVIVRQPQTLMPQLRLQDAVLFAEVLDDVVLFPLEPAEK